jgi:hypothetical protein
MEAVGFALNGGDAFSEEHERLKAIINEQPG